MSNRRDFLGFTAGAVAARTVLPMAAKAAPIPVIAPGNPDAELIRQCRIAIQADTRANEICDSVAGLRADDPRAIAASTLKPIRLRADRG